LAKLTQAGQGPLEQSQTALCLGRDDSGLPCATENETRIKQTYDSGSKSTSSSSSFTMRSPTLRYSTQAYACTNLHRPQHPEGDSVHKAAKPGHQARLVQHWRLLNLLDNARLVWICLGSSIGSREADALQSKNISHISAGTRARVALVIDIDCQLF